LNYWPRWISAIKKRTATLSLMQMGAYDRLLDHYYAEEQPLPGTLDECYRIVSATSNAEKEAVRFVLAKFFVLADGQYRNERADEELVIGLKKIAAAQANGKTGGRPAGSKKKPSGLPNGNPVGTHQAGQSEPTAKALYLHQHQDYTEDLPVPGGGDENLESIVGKVQPTAAGAVCIALKEIGISRTNPGHPTLLALLEAGASMAEFVGAGVQAAGKDDPFAYVLTVVKKERERAAKLVLHRGALPNKQQALEQRNRSVADEWATQTGEAEA
jgi:uncharacterized protein YdaU (DUF1376 family)